MGGDEGAGSIVFTCGDNTERLNYTTANRSFRRMTADHFGMKGIGSISGTDEDVYGEVYFDNLQFTTSCEFAPPSSAPTEAPTLNPTSNPTDAPIASPSAEMQTSAALRLDVSVAFIAMCLAMLH